MNRQILPIFIFLFALTTSSRIYAQCNSAYGHSKTFTFNNSGAVLTDFQVKVDVNTQSMIGAGHLQASGNDIRFTDASCNNLNYWIESGLNTAHTIIWVKVNSLAASTATSITMYYGNATATAGSNGAGTFESFDDFEGASLSGWSVIGTTTWTIVNFDGGKKLKGTNLVTNSGAAAVKYTGALTDYAVEMDYYNDNSNAMGGPLFEYTNNTNYYAIHSMTAPTNVIMHSKITNGSPNYNEQWPYSHANNTWYKWSIEKRSTGSAVYFDNTKITDLPVAFGTGAGVWGYGSDASVIYFDNFRVRKLAPTNALTELFGPAVTSLTPATHTTGIAPEANLSMAFAAAVKKGTGNITIYKSADNSVIEQIDVTSNQVTVSGSSVTINPANDLPPSTEVYVLIDAGAFTDLGNTTYTGISGIHTWMFETDIIKTAQTISFDATNSVVYGASDFDPAATSTNATIPVTYTSSNTSVATIVNGKIHILKAGTTEITASQASNATYSAAPDKVQTLTISPKALTLTVNATPAITKTYNGNANATLAAGNYTINGTVGTDVVSVSGTASYDNKNTGTGKSITINSFVLAGADKDNYTLSTGSASTTGAITAKQITLTLNAAPAITKEYDGDTEATLAAANYKLNGVVGSETVGVTGTAAYDNKNAGSGKVVTVTDLVLSGTDKDNYSLTTISSATTAAITKKALLITAEDKVKYVGTENPALTASYDGFVTGEDHTVLATQANLSTTATITSPIGEYAIDVDGAAAANYSITYKEGVLTVKPGAPTSVIFDKEPLPENQAAGAVAGLLSSTSDDPAATFTYSLVAGNGDTNNTLFTISGNKVTTAGTLNFEQQHTFNIRVRSTTQHGFSLDQMVTIELTDVNELPTLDPPADKTLCYTSTQQTVALSGISAGPDAGQTTSLSVSSDNSALFETLTVTGTGATGQVVFVAKPTASGTAIVSVKVKDNGGTDHGGVDEVVQTFSVVVNPNPAFTITSEKGNTISLGTSTRLTVAGSSIKTVSWTPVTGLDQATSLTPVARPLQNTTYTVTATSEAGCITTGTISIAVKEDLTVLSPKVIITPNGDGINDRFVIENIDAYPNNKLQVFDRSGKVVYEKQNYNNNWDGQIRNRSFVNDTYFYVLTVNGNVLKKGSITIVK